VAGDDELVEVRGGGLVERLEREFVDLLKVGVNRRGMAAAPRRRRREFLHQLAKSDPGG
jgi:hypothetical protein